MHFYIKYTVDGWQMTLHPAFLFPCWKYAVALKKVSNLSLFFPDVLIDLAGENSLKNDRNIFFSSACLIRGSCVFAFEHKRWILLAVSRGDDLLLWQAILAQNAWHSCRDALWQALNTVLAWCGFLFPCAKKCVGLVAALWPITWQDADLGLICPSTH